MTKILFLQKNWFELQGIMRISSMLKKHGHECSVLIQPAEINLIETIKKFSPQIIAFSTVSEERNWALEWAGKIKFSLSNIITVFGGIDPTLCPEIIKSPLVDVVCRGEGEYPMLDLANCIQNNEPFLHIKNMWFKSSEGEIIRNELRDLIENLDDLPSPDYEIYFKKYPILAQNPIKRFIVSRGCPYACSYCCNHFLRILYNKKGKYLRRSSPEKVIEEVKMVVNRYPTEVVDFSDDVFITDKAWLKKLLDLYKKEIDLPFTCLIRIDMVDDEIAKLLKDAGCRTVSFGIESGNEEIRKKVLKKSLSDKSIYEGAKILKSHGIKFMTYNMLNIPNETFEDGLKTVQLNASITTDYPWCSILQPYPCTEFFDRLVEYKGFGNEFAYSEDYIDNLSFHVSSLIDNKDSNRLINLHKFFYLIVKYPSLSPLIKSATSLTPNAIFNTIFLIYFVTRFKGVYGISLLKTIKFNTIHLRGYFKNFGRRAE